MKLYLSGPITGIKNYRKHFESARITLEKSGYAVEDPTTYGFDENSPWHKCMKFDIREMLLCDGVAYLDGWQQSKGARIEISLARSLGIPVKPVHAWERIAGCYE